MSNPEHKIQELHLVLPKPATPVAKYKMAVKVGNLIYISGHGPARISNTTPLKGRLGQDLSLDQGKEAARAVGLNILATLKDQLGTLDKVVCLVKTLGLVNSTVEFLDHPKVINGFSELMAEVFGEDAGVGARSAIGTNVLPGNIPVEIECIFQVK